MPVAAYAQPEPSPSPTAQARRRPLPTRAPAGSTQANSRRRNKKRSGWRSLRRRRIPVGNITVVPFQNNFNYGVGPYTRLQYNLNVQPVIPIMLSPSMTLIARTIFPIVNQPSAAPPAVCVSPNGCPSTFGIGDTQEQFFFAPKTKPDQLIWGVGPIFQAPTGSPACLLRVNGRPVPTRSP